MAKYEFVKPTRADAEYIATNLKPDNYSELFCAIGPNALDDILDGLKHSDEIGCLHINGVPRCIWSEKSFDNERRGSRMAAYDEGNGEP